MIEKNREVLDIGGETSANFTEFPKYKPNPNTYGEPNTYGAEKCSIDFIYLYLTKRKQKTKIEPSFSTLEALLSVLSQWF